ncbi:MAG TPA: DUF4349 domain-containing protein [Solirubrobacteraceae bacterium]|jgi:hypothetical protein|nr:DUF4349 domain-containing protein [Solirubrobacteraceae bacterium]
MKVIPFPGASGTGPEENWLAELEAALSGTGQGPRADSWLQLRDDVRALAPPMDPEFERELGQRIAERSARSVPKRPHRRLGWLRPTAPAFAAVPVALAVIAAVLIAAPWRPANHAAGPSTRSSSTSARANQLGPAFGQAENAPVAGAIHAAKSAAPAPSASASAGAATNAPLVVSGAAAPGRVQQLGASISLSATPSEVQTVADRVSRLAVSDGGFVQSSHVNETEKAGEATLTLSLPSTKLNAALAALGQIAPVHAENQSLQDITNTYNAARQRLNDATAERQALLRALAKATAEGQIDSLRERISQNRGAIARAKSAFQTVSQQASTAEVEVTVLGDKSPGSEGLTLHRGLHDAGRVLTVTLIVLLIAAAVLVPLTLLIAALITARRMWRSYRRERILDAP